MNSGRKDPRPASCALVTPEAQRNVVYNATGRGHTSRRVSRLVFWAWVEALEPLGVLSCRGVLGDLGMSKALLVVDVLSDSESRSRIQVQSSGFVGQRRSRGAFHHAPCTEGDLGSCRSCRGAWGERFKLIYVAFTPPLRRPETSSSSPAAARLRWEWYEADVAHVDRPKLEAAVWRGNHPVAHASEGRPVACRRF